MENKRSRVLYTRDAWHTLQFVMFAWCRDCTVSIVEAAGMGAWQYGNCPLKGGGSINTAAAQGKTDEDYAFEEMADEVFAKFELPRDFATGGLDAQFTGTITTTDAEALGTHALITLDKACAWLRFEFEVVVRRMKIRQASATTPGTVGRFRTWLHWTRAIAKSETYLALGIERLKQSCLTQNKRPRGPQSIQTRKRIPVGYYQSFTYCGTHAMRIPPGRPSLSKAEWVERYKARRAAQRKTDRVRKDKRGPVKVPQTKHGRPSRAIRAQIQIVKSNKSTSPRFEVASDFDSDAVLTEFRNNIA